jgi:hypothetical protein
MIKAFLSLFTGGLLDRILDTVDKRVQAESDRDRIKGEIIQEHLRTRPDFMRAGGFWLMLLFAVPLALWFAAVIVYSVFWCQGCAYPQTWTVAALPSPLDQWAGGIIVSIFGVVGLDRYRR